MGMKIEGQKRFVIISCAVFARECYRAASMSSNIIDVMMMDQGLHDVGEDKMCDSLQKVIDGVDVDKYDAILLLYGLCNNGIRSLSATIPLVVPKAHDCITILMGSKERYSNYFNANPGTFYMSDGWVERAGLNMDNPESTTSQMGMVSYEEYVETYGEECAKFLYDALGDHLKNYTKLTYIDTGNSSVMQKRESKLWSERKLWEYEEYSGDTRLISMLMDGEWNINEFLVVNPGSKINVTYDDEIVGSVPNL